MENVVKDKMVISIKMGTNKRVFNIKQAIPDHIIANNMVKSKQYYQTTVQLLLGLITIPMVILNRV